ncbi:MAG: superoxide dismutase family protein [Candidatus Spyradocola sp.]
MNQHASRPDAVAYIRGGADAPGMMGRVRFYQEPDSVLVVADVGGFPQNGGSGFYGFHIHEGAACTGAAFADTGGHYNPAGAEHPSHAGDLPPLMTQQGRAHLAVRTDRFRVQDVLGRTVVIHSHPDDFHTQPSGDSGTRIACGVIAKNQR